MSDASDLEVLFPGRDVKCKGETITVTPLFFGQYPAAVRLIRPLATALQGSGAFKFKPVTQADGKVEMSLTYSDNLFAAIPLILETGGEALIQFFAFAISKPREWFNTLPGDEGFELANAILMENKDFFVRRILPMLEGLGLMKMAEQTIQAGAPSSQDLPATDTTTSPT